MGVIKSRLSASSVAVILIIGMIAGVSAYPSQSTLANASPVQDHGPQTPHWGDGYNTTSSVEVGLANTTVSSNGPALTTTTAPQPIPVSKYFGNTYNSTQIGATTLTNSSQMVDIRFTARYGGTAVPRVNIGIDYYVPGAEYDLLIGIQTDSSGMPSGDFLGSFVWNVSSGFCNGCGGWVYPGFAPKASPLDQTITLAPGNVYHIVMKYFNGTFANNGLCFSQDCLVLQYIGGSNFQRESLDMHYDPSQALLSCARPGRCTVVPGANVVYALDFNGSTWWQGQSESLVLDRGIGTAKGGSGLDSYQGERFWMLWDTVTVSRLQVLLSKVGTPDGRLNVLIWNFSAASGGSILASSDARLVLNQTLIANLSSMPAAVDRPFNFTLTKDVTFQTHHLYQLSFAIYGNTTAVGGSNEVGIAVVSSSHIPNALNWDGVDGSSFPCHQYEGGCAGFRYVGGTEDSTAEEVPAEDLIFIMKISASAVIQPMSIEMSNSAPSASVSVNGCYPTPSSFPSDGNSHPIQMLPSCSFTLSFSNSGNSRDGFSASGSFMAESLPQSSCPAGTCSEMLFTAYHQLQNTYRANPAAPSTWDAGLTIPVSGTQLGSAGQTGCSISTIEDGEVASCTAWFDYRTEVNVASPIAVSGTERWINSGRNNFTQATGSNQDTVNFVDQFQIAFRVGPLGAGSTNPSGPKLWENYGPLPVTASPNEGYLFSNWSADVGGIVLLSAQKASTTATILGSGTITATFLVPVTQSVNLALAESQGTTARFTLSGCSISPTTLQGDGMPHSFTALPDCQLTVLVPSDGPDVRYRFNLEGTVSSSTLLTTCSENACSEFSATYFEQVGQQFSYAVVGGASPYLKAPALSFTALGTGVDYAVTQSPMTQWLDFGTSWSLANPLVGSTGTERWFAPSGISGIAAPGGEQVTTYQHQYSVVIAAIPSDCGGTTPSGADWRDSGADFKIAGSARPGCTFAAWETTGLVTIAKPRQLSTTAFADSTGTITASFSRDLVPTFPTRTLVLILGVGCIAVVAVGVLLIGRRGRSKIQHG